jgi:uncharacterized protein YggE
MKISMMKTLCSLAALALCWSSPRTSLAQQPAPQAGARLWTIKSVGTETATPDVYYLLMKMEYQSGLAAEATTQGEKRLSDFLAAVDALKIPNFSYRICNNLITPASDQQVTGMVYTRNVVFKLMSSQAGQPLPGRDAIIAKLEDLGARYNSHCVTCIGSG